LHLAILVLAWLGAWLITGPIAALLAVLFTEVWLTSFESTHLWYDIALAPFYLAIVALLCAKTPFGSYRSMLVVSTLVGLLVGVATLVKQHAILTLPVVAIVLYLQTSKARSAPLACLTAGFALPILVAVAYFAANGALNDALYWTVAYSFDGDYARLAALSPAPDEWPTLALLYAPALAALLLLITDHARSRRTPDTRFRWQTILLLGLLTAATLPAFPRYGRFHLAAAVPLLGVLVGTLISYITTSIGARSGNHSAFRIPHSALLRLMSALLAVASFAWGGFLWPGAQQLISSFGAPKPPYASSITPLRAWVDSHAPPGSQIAMYGLDPLLLRVLEREPTRPFVPQVKWIFFTGGREARMWAGIVAAHPQVALVSGTGWADSPQPGPDTPESRLRYNYQENARFSVTTFSGATPVQVVCLLRNKSDGHGNHDNN
jgi:hypothetical protein